MIDRGIACASGGYPLYMPGLRKVEAALTAIIYADVAIDSLTREIGERLFTYQVPGHLRDEVFVGSQVLVPLGHQDLVAGYVVGLSDAASHPGSGQFKVRAIAEVLESEPLFDRDYVALLNWVSDYYAASIADVIAAALPADLNPKVRSLVRLLQESAAPDAGGIVAALKASRTGTLSVKALKQKTQLSAARFYPALAELRQSAVVAVERESAVKAQPKLVAKVILTGTGAATRKQEDVVAALKRAGGSMTVSALVEAAGTTHGTIKRMCGSGVLALVHDEVIRDPLAHLEPAAGKPAVLPELTADQARAYFLLLSELEAQLSRTTPAAVGRHVLLPAAAGGGARDAVQPWLLHGVTGSGKTEIYLRLIAHCLAAGRTALMLVPEISLTPQLAERLVSRFGDQVAVWHSGLSPGERFDTWRRLRAGQARVLLGARSAVLANIPQLGLIILDEEHDGSYKQSSPSPRYHAKTVALERAAQAGAMVLYGSATPDVATFKECRDAGRIAELPRRVFQQELPRSVIVDMRQEYALGNRSLFSRRLQDAICERLRRKQQSILLINRRGYASHVFCRACGFVTKCRHCSVSLVFHQLNAEAWRAPSGADAEGGWQSGDESSGYLMCHHCGFKMAAWLTCPDCQSPFVRQLGLGTQRVEQEAQALFPEARLLRLDSDITSRKGAYEEVFRQFASGQADILIGTQMVAKGLDIEAVTLVGVLAADSAFNLPDYRSVERGFQLLTQVSGRAGRGQHEGEVILQTFNADLPALALARSQDYASFVEQELSARRDFEYPPYSQIIRVVVQGERQEEVELAGDQLAEELSTHLDEEFNEEEIKILGPAPCLIERLRGKYRHHLLIKNLAGEPGRKAIVRFLRQRRGTAKLSLAVDVEALDLI